MHPMPRLTAAICFALLSAGPLACGPMEPDVEPAPLTLQQQELESDNGLAANGLSANGLSANGLSANGLSANGLSANGLSQLSFAAWFQQAPTQRDTVMQYLVRCAVPAGQVRTYTDDQTQQTYTWQGVLGLAPGWSNGHPATLAEQQLVSACLAAHINKFGVSVPISVLGVNTAGQFIPFSFEEIVKYSRKEACFFGNLFNGEGIFFGSEAPRLHDHESSSRACTLSSKDPAVANGCPPLAYAGRCNQLCERVDHMPFYSSCTFNGVTYKPLTTRVRKSEIYACGDGVCQISEKCSTGKNLGCERDCGRCADSTQ